VDEIKLRKKKLETSAELHKQAMTNELKSLNHKTEKLVGDAKSVVVVLIALIALYKLLSAGGDTKKPRKRNRLLSVLKQQAKLYMLNTGRSKISEYIDSLDEKK
jgi:hypothetical protein